ncbi:MAG: glycosyltransferase family 1 protein [Verrucomicrobia bacterium]|nr:glycosyltransferase family 1 protein [Verrucomicrobiota bacterium]
MKLGFISLNLPGHINPMSALARHLQARGHEVVFLYSSHANGLPCVPGNDRDPVNESRPEVSRLQGEGALAFAVGLILERSEAMLRSMPSMIEAPGVDALIIDPIQFYVELAAIKLGVPYIHAAVALHLDYSGYTPFPLCGDPYETTPEALARNRQGVAKFTKMLLNEGVHAYAKEAGLDVNWEDGGSTISKLAWLTQTPREFDFPTAHWPAEFHYTGPYHDGKGREPMDFPWDRLTGEPLIYSSMGTILNGNAEVFRTIAAGVAKHKDVQLVLSIGDQLEPEQIGRVPKNAIIVKRAPQLELLKLASVCITHSGLNTVLESLTQGVPQVAVPVTFEQPGIAARIAYHQTGVVTSLEKLTPGHLSKLLREVMEDPMYQANARRIQRAIANADGLTTACDVIEQCLVNAGQLF